MMIDTNYAIISHLPNNILEPIIIQCEALDWTTVKYCLTFKQSRHTIEFEFPKNHSAGFAQNDTERNLVASCNDLIAFIENIFDHGTFLRGEISTLMPQKGMRFHKDHAGSDKDQYHSYAKRLHIPIITNEKAYVIWCDDTLERVQMEVGKIYEMNNQRLHCAYNNGNQPRVHVVFDVVP